ncbi:hypothetical protein ACHHYP_08274 [Achlya hypogyna]|uniref:Uncharacterized protein n=1 Tax=Achlya hypogyna TaxID=1202772 RepID=A0A1V9ZL12_ACHHY|nr:hypothetical protein ACHHYP_08274 [Achlya hypogyna]
MERPAVVVLGPPGVGKTSLIHAIACGLEAEAQLIDALTSVSWYRLGECGTVLEVALDNIAGGLAIEASLVVLVFDLTAPASFAVVVAKAATLQAPGRTIAVVGAKADLLPSDHDAILVASEARIYASSEFHVYTEAALLEPSAAGLDALVALVRATCARPSAPRKTRARRDIWLYDPYDDNAPPRSPTRAKNDIYAFARAKAQAHERATSAKYQHVRHYASPKAVDRPAPRPASPPPPPPRSRKSGRHSTLMCSTQSSLERIKATRARQPPAKEEVDPMIRVPWHRTSSVVDWATADELPAVPRAAAKSGRPKPEVTRAATPPSANDTGAWEVLVAVPTPLPPWSSPIQGTSMVDARNGAPSPGPLKGEDTDQNEDLIGGGEDGDSVGPVSDHRAQLPATDAAASDGEVEEVDGNASIDNGDDVNFDDDDILDALDAFNLSI